MNIAVIVVAGSNDRHLVSTEKTIAFRFEAQLILNWGILETYYISRQMDSQILSDATIRSTAGTGR